MGHTGGNLAWRWASPTQSPALPGYVRKPGTICRVIAPHDLEATVFLLKELFVLFMTVLGLCCFAGFALDAASRGSSQAAVLGLLIAMASLAAELGSRALAQ